MWQKTVRLWFHLHIRRVFYPYDVPADAKRGGGHSHYQAEELIIALSGSFDVVLDDGKHAPERFFVEQALYRTIRSHRAMAHARQLLGRIGLHGSYI